MSKELLISNLQSLRNQLDWLEHSYSICKNISIKQRYETEEFDAFETLCSRFARSIDFLVRKVFRSVDDVEFENQGTLIDVINNAHKRGLFDSIENIRNLKDLRNDIAHEYLDEGLRELFEEILSNTPELMKIIANTIRYCDRYST